jgi:hypothetical protein
LALGAADDVAPEEGASDGDLDRIVDVLAGHAGAERLPDVLEVDAVGRRQPR